MNIVDYNSISEIDWAMLAAYIDSEGCVRIVRGKARSGRTPETSHGSWHGTMLHVTNTDLRLLNWCKQTFGGIIIVQTMHDGRRTVYDWRAFNKNVTAILKRCLPYFKIKREQAELAIAFRETMTGTTKKLAPEVVAKRDEMFLQMKALKRKDFGEGLPTQ